MSIPVLVTILIYIALFTYCVAVESSEAPMFSKRMKLKRFLVLAIAYSPIIYLTGQLPENREGFKEFFHPTEQVQEVKEQDAELIKLKLCNEHNDKEHCDL